MDFEDSDGFSARSAFMITHKLATVMTASLVKGLDPEVSKLTKIPLSTSIFEACCGLRLSYSHIGIFQGSPEHFPLVYYATLSVILYLAIFYVFIVDTELLDLDAQTYPDAHPSPEDENRRRKESWRSRPRLVQTCEY